MARLPPAESPEKMMFFGEILRSFSRYRYDVRLSWRAAGNGFDVFETGRVERRYCGQKTCVASVCLSSFFAIGPLAAVRPSPELS